MTQLKPCPYCGNSNPRCITIGNLVDNIVRGFYYAFYYQCYCGFSSKEGEESLLAKENWNESNYDSYVNSKLKQRNKMKIIINPTQNKKLCIAYPCLMVSTDSNCIIWFTAWKRGIVVKGGGLNELGFYSDTWSMHFFKPWKGSIELVDED